MPAKEQKKFPAVHSSEQIFYASPDLKLQPNIQFILASPTVNSFP